MSADVIDLARLGERLAALRWAYDENIGLPNLGANLFALLLGVSVSAYESYECGEQEPTLAFLVTLRKKMGVSLDWLLDSNQPEPCRHSADDIGLRADPPRPSGERPSCPSVGGWEDDVGERLTPAWGCTVQPVAAGLRRQRFKTVQGGRVGSGLLWVIERAA